MVEALKWRKPSNPDGVPVWSHAGINCTGETYKTVVKMTFAKGTSLEDLSGFFTSVPVTARGVRSQKTKERLKGLHLSK